MQEEAQGRPFVGASGQKLIQWWRGVGLQRTDFYLTNVVPFRPPGNKIEAVPRLELDEWTDRLHERLAELTDPWVLVPTGNVALRALTGKSKITKHRGSIYEYIDRRQRRVKVIPTIHPAASFRMPRWEKRCVADWRRIAGDAQFRELRLPMREHLTRPTLGDIKEFVNIVADARFGADKVLALDIETPGGEVVCVGFSYDPTFSLTIPLTNEYESAERWEAIRELCRLPCAKALQNGHYDAYYLAARGIRLRQWRWDTLSQHHCLDATDSHDLAYMASIDTRQPYWKDEAKDPDEAQKYASNLDALLAYNGLDVCTTRELADVYAGRLADRGLLGFYDRHYRQMFAPLLSLMRHGVGLDQPSRARRHARLTAACLTIQDRLTVLAGEPLYGKKDLSTKRLARFLYETLRLPKQIDRATGKVTTKEVAVRRLMIRVPTRIGDAGPLILEHRRKKKLSEFLEEGNLDDDGRMRCTYKFTTENGRLASSKTPRGTGRNLQNIDRDVRDVFIPDRGCCFLELDLSQAESRVVYVRSGDDALVTLARRSPTEYDVHRDNATIIFRVAPERVTPEQRYLAKRGVHAGHYGLRGRRLSDELLKDGYVVAPEECDGYIDAYMAKRPGVPQWQRAIRGEILRKKALTNSWGREIDFTHDRLEDDLYRRAYAWKPASDVADLMNQWGFVPLHAFLRGQRMRSRINLHNHDALLLSVRPDEAYDIAAFARESLERPRVYDGIELTIPLTYKLGPTWKASVEMLQLPARAEFEEAVGGVMRRRK